MSSIELETYKPCSVTMGFKGSGSTPLLSRSGLKRNLLNEPIRRYFFKFLYTVYRVCQKKTPQRNFDIRYFCTIFVWLIEEIFSHIFTKFYCKILKTSKVMKFLRKILKFQINQAYKTKKIFFKFLCFIQIYQAYKIGSCLINIKHTYRSQQIRQN